MFSASVASDWRFFEAELANGEASAHVGKQDKIRHCGGFTLDFSRRRLKRVKLLRNSADKQLQLLGSLCCWDGVLTLDVQRLSSK